MTDRPDPHPDMRGCFKFIPIPNAPAGTTFTCPECGRVYLREKPRGGLPMWREQTGRKAPGPVTN